MIIKIKNKDTLNIGEFKLKCCLGKKGISKNKFEGDLTTPKGKFKLGKLYWRADRVQKPITSLFCKKIKKIWGGVMILIVVITIRKLKKIKKINMKNYIDMTTSMIALF